MKFEIMAPAGNFHSIPMLISAGADVIYVGLSGFSSRPLYADLTIKEIEKNIIICKAAKVKLHVAINACLYHSKIDELLSIINKLDEIKVDAIIISDWGLIHYLSTKHHSFEIHASTLLGVYNSETVVELKRLGVTRVIFSTNLYLDEIASIINAVPDMDYELVADGGICFNDNRLCTLPHSCSNGSYKVHCKSNYVLQDGNTIIPAKMISSKHIKSDEILTIYIGVGISSFKIEGRTADINEILLRIKTLIQARNEIVKSNRDITACLHYVQRIHNTEGR